ncbi:AraC family transcriptional regulator [Smaragdicoccus niigatensis]|uniref:AraC family transcriptional regulator n=1 Tax=Smaragdicoccus niigatensis TaxID=359359 RepID=UPI0003749A22|nr:AraC family transcriptional regulator [Smaragdicoccus niigatensis]
MSFIRGTSLLGFRELVHDLGADPDRLLRTAHVPVEAVGDQDCFIGSRAVMAVLEAAASATKTPDFGRQLALRQGIEVLGPVGVAARTAATVGTALAAIEQYMSVYSGSVSVTIDPQATTRNALLEWRIVEQRVPPHAQSAELSIGLALRTLRLFAGAEFTLTEVQFRHQPLGPIRDYERYFDCPVSFGKPGHGLLFPRVLLSRPLAADAAVHDVVREYLNTIARPAGASAVEPIRQLIRRTLPTGRLTRDLVAAHLALHPRTLQRHLEARGTSFDQLVDDVRRQEAERYLRDTDVPLGQIASIIGYTEQSALTRSSKRWFGQSPSAIRRTSTNARNPP